MRRLSGISGSGQTTPGSSRIPSAIQPPVPPHPGRFLSSRPDSPRPTEFPLSLNSSSPPAEHRRTERTTVPTHKPGGNLPRDLTGQITREHSEWPNVTGGYGFVWRGSWQNGTKNCKVAIKVLRFNRDGEDKRQKLHKRLRKEIEIWRRLDHKNIVPLFGTTSEFSSDCSTGMVSPWMNYGNLTTYQERPLTLSQRLQLLCDVATGLEYLHSKHVIHGDLTGSNILIDDDGTARLIDFGLSTIKPEFDGNSFNSSTIGGAIRWLAPELLAGSGKTRVLNQSSDIYSLGSVILQALSGEVPYHYLQTVQVVLELDGGRLPRRPPESCVTDSHWKLINQCWNKEPGARPPIQDVKHRLLALHRASGVKSSPSTKDRYSQNLTNSPVFQRPSRDLPETHLLNIAAAKTPTSLPSLIIKSSLPSTPPTFDKTTLPPSISKMKSGSHKARDHPGKTTSLNLRVEPSEGLTAANDKRAQRTSTIQSSSPLNHAPSHRIRHSRSDIAGQKTRNTPSARMSIYLSTDPIPEKTEQGNFNKALPPCPVTDGYEPDSPYPSARTRRRSNTAHRRSIVNSRGEEASQVTRPASLSLSDTIRSHQKMAADAIRFQTPAYQ